MSTRTWKPRSGRRTVAKEMRPKKQPSELKGSIIKIRVTDEQKRAFESAAAREAMDLSVFARIALIEKSRRSGITI